MRRSTAAIRFCPAAAVYYRTQDTIRVGRNLVMRKESALGGSSQCCHESGIKGTVGESLHPDTGSHRTTDEQEAMGRPKGAQQKRSAAV
jgi:hypothetical protein